MDPQFEAFLRSWDFRPDLILILLLFGVAYTIGWVKLRLKKAHIANGWRLASYYVGLVFLAAALFSGLAVFESQLFFIHMVQHLFLLMLAPPFLLLANPMVFLIWSLPNVERKQVGRLLRSKSGFRKGFVAITTPWMIWLIYTINLIVWHDPNAYEAAIENALLHDIEHATFFYAGMGLWWHVTGVAPKFHGKRSYPLRMLLIVMSFFVNLFVGVGITLSPDILYDYYETVPRTWNVSVESDQRIGGLLMWIPGGMMYLMTFLILGINLVAESERKARLGDHQRRLKFEGVSQPK